jgi:hypothetical protein
MIKTKRITTSRVIAIVATILFLGGDAAMAQAPESDYRIGPNDVLSIFVWKEPELTRDVTVMPGQILSPSRDCHETDCWRSDNDLNSDLSTRSRYRQKPK